MEAAEGVEADEPDGPEESAECAESAAAWSDSAGGSSTDEPVADTARSSVESAAFTDHASGRHRAART